MSYLRAGIQNMQHNEHKKNDKTDPNKKIHKYDL